MMYNINTTSMIYGDYVPLKEYEDHWGVTYLYWSNQGNDHKLKNSGFRIKIDHKTKCWNWQKLTKIPIKLEHSNLKESKYYSIKVSVQSVLNWISEGVGIDSEGYLGGTFSLIHQDYYKSDKLFHLVSEGSVDHKIYNEIIGYKSKTGTSKWIPGHRYIDKNNYSEYLYLGQLWLFGDYDNWYTSKSCPNIRGFKSSAPERVHIYFRLDRSEFIDGLLKKSSSMTDFLIDYYYEFSSSKSFENYFGNQFSLIARSKLPSMVDEGSVLKNSDFDFERLKDIILKDNMKNDISDGVATSLLVLSETPFLNFKEYQLKWAIRKFKRNNGYGFLGRLSGSNFEEFKKYVLQQYNSHS